MSYRFPGFEVASCTAIWILIAFGAGLTFFVSGELRWYLAVCMVTGLAGLGMWFQIRFAGHVFGTINALLAAIGVLALVAGGFSLRTAIRAAANAYMAWVAFNWAATADD